MTHRVRVIKNYVRQHSLDGENIKTDCQEIDCSYTTEPKMKKLIRAMMLINLLDIC